MRSDNRGFTLTEMIVYVGLFSVILVITVSFILDVLGVYGKVQTKKAVVNEGESALNAMLKEIETSQSVYTPTSVFGSASGALALKTAHNIPSDETYGFTDIYLDNGKVWLKREGQSSLSLTSDRLLATALTFAHLDAGTNYESVKITINLESRFGKGNLKSTASFTSTATPRGDY